jgi:uroporphyrinogen decarboxylase
VIGVDWRFPLDQAWQSLDHRGAVQGNLDPVLLFADQKELLAQAARILRQAGGRPGHIFNLGHGILPETPVESVRALVDFVRDWNVQSSPEADTTPPKTTGARKGAVQ